MDCLCFYHALLQAQRFLPPLTVQASFGSGLGNDASSMELPGLVLHAWIDQASPALVLAPAASSTFVIAPESESVITHC